MGKSTIELEEEMGQMGLPILLEQGIGEVITSCEIEDSARESGALLRCRGVQTAMGLLRIVMGYSMLDYSLRLLGAWANVLGIANLSKTALLRRLQKCRGWIGRLVVIALERRKVFLPQGVSCRIKLLDATVICQPGSKGADWRLHLGFDLRAGCMDQVEITNGKGAELASRFRCQAGEIWIGDRAYAIARSLAHFVYSGAWLVIRSGWNRVAWENESGQRFDLIGWLKKANLHPQGPAQETQVWISSPQGHFPLRLIAKAVPESEAERSRRHVRRAAKKNHHTPDERSLFAAGYILLLTNLPTPLCSVSCVLALYHFRWQVELAFKRLKSLIHLDHLRAKDPQLAQVYLLSKLLAVILMEQIQLHWMDQYPAAFLSQDRPISLWRLNALLWDHLCSLVRGSISLDEILAAFPRLLRYLSDEPRSRPNQLASARSLLSNLGAC